MAETRWLMNGTWVAHGRPLTHFGWVIIGGDRLTVGSPCVAHECAGIKPKNIVNPYPNSNPISNPSRDRLLDWLTW